MNTINQYKYDAGADIKSAIYILIADVTANITYIRTRPLIRDKSPLASFVF